MSSDLPPPVAHLLSGRGYFFSQLNSPSNYQVEKCGLSGEGLFTEAQLREYGEARVAELRAFHGEMARESRKATEVQLASYSTQCAELAQQYLALRDAADELATAVDEFMNYRHDGVPAIRYNLRVMLNRSIQAYKATRENR